jgi:hypothetical protein
VLQVCTVRAGGSGVVKNEGENADGINHFLLPHQFQKLFEVDLFRDEDNASGY